VTDQHPGLHVTLARRMSPAERTMEADYTARIESQARRMKGQRAAEQRQALEHLCRDIRRPAIANEPVSVNHAGQVVLKLKTVYPDGMSDLVMSLLQFMQRLAALVPRPRLHLIRFHAIDGSLAGATKFAGSKNGA
jgi:hypothetical protein